MILLRNILDSESVNCHHRDGVLISLSSDGVKDCWSTLRPTLWIFKTVYTRWNRSAMFLFRQWWRIGDLPESLLNSSMKTRPEDASKQLPARNDFGMCKRTVYTEKNSTSPSSFRRHHHCHTKDGVHSSLFLNYEPFKKNLPMKSSFISSHSY